MDSPIRHVLIIDDHREDVELIRHSLLSDRTHRYVFGQAVSCGEALRLLSAEPNFDLIVLNWQLPRDEVTRLFKSLESDDTMPQFPIVLLTASDTPDIGRNAIRAGVQDYLRKELLVLGILPRVVTNAIEKHRLLKVLFDKQQIALEAQRKAEESSRAKNAFLTCMSHELRTPLTAIVGLADLLLDRPEDDDTREMLEMIQANGNHLTRLLGDLLDLAKVEVGKSSVRKIECSIVVLTREVCQIMRHRAIEAGLPLELHISEDVPKVVFTDPVYFRQIMLNLIGNAIKFTHQGSIDITLSASDDTANHVAVEVRDTGPGIPCDIQKRLFEPFVQGNPGTSGMGLGLSISHSLARALGGKLELVSQANSGGVEPRIGSVFVLQLPIGESIPSGSDCDSEHPPHDKEFVNSLSGRRVLIAEDTHANQFLLRRLLEPLGAEVTIVGDGHQAIEAIREVGDEAAFDLTLMDMQMPIVDGYEATHILRQSGYRGQIVAITAAAMTGDAEKCLAAGCNAYVTKPINRRELLCRLDRCLRLADSEKGQRL